jgi:hypothetical protein
MTSSAKDDAMIRILKRVDGDRWTKGSLLPIDPPRKHMILGWVTWIMRQTVLDFLVEVALRTKLVETLGDVQRGVRGWR